MVFGGVSLVGSGGQGSKRMTAIQTGQQQKKEEEKNGNQRRVRKIQCFCLFKILL